jgi:hypothetical protein
MVNESSLKLLFWEDTLWLDAATTCTPHSNYERDLAANRLSVEICHLTKFAMFGETQYRISIPLILRDK